MKKIIAVIALAAVLSCALATAASAAYDTWGEVVDEMSAVCDEAYDIYISGDVGGAKAKVDVAYFSYYEKLGFERTVMAYVSGDRASLVEYQFSFIKKAMTNGEAAPEIRTELDLLVQYLREDANRLDGKEESAPAVFLASLLIIAREGFEAIIIVGAIVAYLVKSGNGKKTAAVYWGSLIALGASVLMAIALSRLSAISGANQEIIEGVTMLIAVAVLFYVSNWMVGKAEADAWSGYIESKVESSLARGSVFSLAFAAFLAVFREGAEVILFYQALLADTQTYINMIWAGLGVGLVALVVIYILIRVLSFRLPLKPFFLGTSILLSVMAISFIGSGIKELQEGNVIGVTPVNGLSSVDLLGIYPTLETLIPQAVLLAITVATFVLQIRKWKKARERASAGEVKS
ncbi:MAG: FTR1 family iron permease [Oscillospiraceae bacterium]|jgi:high-affinity iron transporter|nr:FTR1 family iron permease [Oscillospiraceae bacterium]